jgi:hypothetical protein
MMMVGIDACGVDIPGGQRGRRRRPTATWAAGWDLPLGCREQSIPRKGLECKETSQGAMRHGLSRGEDLIVDLTK